MPLLHHTYLSEKLYQLLDESGDGKIQEDEFMNGMRNVLSSRDFRLKCKNLK
jgi:Ca2+-binding EF-hand superfamily protein